jgi:hypothetical protein
LTSQINSFCLQIQRVGCESTKRKLIKFFEDKSLGRIFKAFYDIILHQEVFGIFILCREMVHIQIMFPYRQMAHLQSVALFSPRRAKTPQTEMHKKSLARFMIFLVASLLPNAHTHIYHFS